MDSGDPCISSTSQTKQKNSNIVSTALLAKQNKETEEIDANKMRKKKKGKKERAAEKAETSGSGLPPGVHAGSESEPIIHPEEGKDGLRSIEEPSGEGGRVEEDQGHRRHRRKKVRSKQKNIYKDRRTDADKPRYLVLSPEGKNRSYRGRPLTAETRAKLNLGDKSDPVGWDRTPLRSSWSYGDDRQRPPVVTATPTQAACDPIEGKPLAIDGGNLLREGDDVCAVGAASPPLSAKTSGKAKTAEQKRKNRKRKPKYKNLL